MTKYSVQIARKVANREDINVTELDCALSDVVDPEALDQLMNSFEDNGQDSAGVLRFEFYGYTVRVSTATGVDIQ
jgi:hypothetical protein